MSSRLLFLVLAAAVLGGAAGRASADWPPCGRAATDAAGSQVHPAITDDGANGAIVVWQDDRFRRVNLFAQHVLANGEVDAAWPLFGRALLADPNTLETSAAGGQFAPVIVSDGAGGAIVAWQDLRDSTT